MLKPPIDIALDNKLKHVGPLSLSYTPLIQFSHMYVFTNSLPQKILYDITLNADNMVMVSTEVIMIAVLRYRPLPEEFVEFVDSEPDNTKNNYKSI